MKEKVLFVNACLRGKEDSRTYGLCTAFLEEFSKNQKHYELEEIDLAEAEIEPIDGNVVNWIIPLQKEKNYEDPVFDLAKQFAAADVILIGAPYWNLMFPATLLAYMEHVFQSGITFKHDRNGRPVGICRAREIVYITTAGGIVFNRNYGFQYFQGIAQMFGIPKCNCIMAQGMDIVGYDIETQMEKTMSEIARFAK